MASVFNDLKTIKRALERPRFGLMTDVDGTISPTAPTPAQAAVSPANRRYLARLTPRLALAAAVSGRAVADVRRLVDMDPSPLAIVRDRFVSTLADLQIGKALALHRGDSGDA